MDNEKSLVPSLPNHLVSACILDNAVGVRSIRSHCDVVAMDTKTAALLVQGLQRCHVRSTLHHLVNNLW